VTNICWLGAQYRIGNGKRIGTRIRVNPEINKASYYGHAFGGSVVSAIYAGSKQADYGYVEATVSF
jgi:hypothetical protein